MSGDPPHSPPSSPLTGDDCLNRAEDVVEPVVQINAWFGPSGTVSPLHFDPKHNLLSQVPVLSWVGGNLVVLNLGGGGGCHVYVFDSIRCWLAGCW